MFFRTFITDKGEGGSIGIYGYESASSSSASNHTYPRSLQIWFDVLTSILDKPILDSDTVLEPRGDLMTADKRNNLHWWRRHSGSAWIPHGDYEPLCLFCLGFLSKYFFSKKKISKYLEGMMVIYV